MSNARSAIKYLRAKKNSWAASTRRSERHRMKVLLRAIEDSGDLGAEGVFKALSHHLSPYSLNTYMVRYAAWQSWAGNTEPKRWMDENRNHFKYSYERKIPLIGLQKAKELIGKVKDEEVKKAALLILSTGMRTCELKTFDGSTVVGKGSKRRKIFTDKKPISVEYSRLYWELKKVGLKPHDLRKIYATEVVKRGATQWELLDIMGWSNVQTATSYVGTEGSRLESLAHFDLSGSNGDDRSS